MTIREVIDEDICAGCAHLCLLEVAHSVTWSAKGICVAGWPRKMFWNVACDCPRYEQSYSKALDSDSKVSERYVESSIKLAEWTGLEPATPGVTGRCSD